MRPTATTPDLFYHHHPHQSHQPAFSQRHPAAVPAHQISDSTMILAILFGVSIGNIATHPILIIALWLGYALYAFYTDLRETLDKRRERISAQAGPLAARLIVGTFQLFVIVAALLLFVGFIRVIRVFR